MSDSPAIEISAADAALALRDTPRDSRLLLEFRTHEVHCTA